MDRAFDIVSMIVVVAGIMVLVRPGSQGPAFVQAVSNGFAGVLTTATGSGVPSGFQTTPWSH